ncbi:CDGSH iron-sulfur domain-containing protein [Rhodococcus olei]|uniref:CDGSH iron-sulfur domain-containing protein n=1 Tax=Rhodococcus olei TaxID=2161675 RepID=UPI0031EC8C1A
MREACPHAWSPTPARRRTGQSATEDCTPAGSPVSGFRSDLSCGAAPRRWSPTGSSIQDRTRKRSWSSVATDPKREVLDAPSCPPEWNSHGAQAIRHLPAGPVLVRGTVRITTDGGRVVVSDRFVVAVCRCGLSSIHPLCDTSHRAHSRSGRRRRNERPDE